MSASNEYVELAADFEEHRQFTRTLLSAIATKLGGTLRLTSKEFDAATEMDMFIKFDEEGVSIVASKSTDQTQRN